MRGELGGDWVITDMAYIKQVLDRDEKIIHQARVHWVVYLLPVLLVLPGAFCLGFSLVQPTLVGVGVVLVLIAFVVWLNALLTRISTELAITDRRVISKIGFIRRLTSEINLSRVEGVSVYQSMLGRMLNYGTVSVTGTGGRIAPMRNIADPLAFRARVRPL